MHQVGFSLHDYIEMHRQQNIIGKRRKVLQEGRCLFGRTLFVTVLFAAGVFISFCITLQLESFFWGGGAMPLAITAL